LSTFTILPRLLRGFSRFPDPDTRKVVIGLSVAVGATAVAAQAGKQISKKAKK
jgi:hypothetical protein